jgi:hypothetical protein
VILQLHAGAVGPASEAPHVHTHREVLALNIAGGRYLRSGLPMMASARVPPLDGREPGRGQQSPAVVFTLSSDEADEHRAYALVASKFFRKKSTSGVSLKR